MDLLGYLIVLTNLQAELRAGAIEDIDVQFGSLQSLATELRSIPNIPEEAFKYHSYRIGDVEIYASKKLQDYMYNHIGYPDEEGMVVRIFYSSLPVARKSNTESYFLHNDNLTDYDKEKIEEFVEVFKNQPQN